MTPTQYFPVIGAITPFAHPTTLNAFIAMGAVGGNRNSQRGSNSTTLLPVPRSPITAPYEMRQADLPATAPPRPIRKVFRSKCYCTTCGWRKVEHTEAEGKPKRKTMKSEDCKCQFCGNCYNMREYHEKEGIPFGVSCTSLTNTFCYTNVNDWWTYTVSRLLIIYSDTMTCC